jgi:hypothetical protein
MIVWSRYMGLIYDRCSNSRSGDGNGGDSFFGYFYPRTRNFSNSCILKGFDSKPFNENFETFRHSRGIDKARGRGTVGPELLG